MIEAIALRRPAECSVSSLMFEEEFNDETASGATEGPSSSLAHVGARMNCAGPLGKETR